MPRYEDEGRDHSPPPLHPQDRGRSGGTVDRRRREYSPGVVPPPSRSHREYRDYDDLYPPSSHHHLPGSSSSSHHHYDVHPPPQRRSLPYKILCVLNLNSKVSDGNIRDALTREFGRFGDVSVKVCFDGSERIAYVYFRCYEDAREARHARSRMILFDKQIEIEPIYDRSLVSSSGSSSSSTRRRSITPPEYRQPPPASMSRRAPSPGHSRRPLPLPPHMRHQEKDYDRGYSSRSETQTRDHHSYREGRDYHDSHRTASSTSTAVSGSNGSNNNGNSHRQNRESKKEKFPNYLHHIAPEEDDKATRTLFVGNLEVSISDPDLRKIFERYGHVVDIDVKRPAPGQGNAYAFIKFLNLDMAHRAKVEMSGQYIGKFQCKIGYGKATPTTRIWVGGLGSWTSLDALVREFDRYGVITKIDFVRGDNHAYIQYDSIDAAQDACQGMRGFPLGGQDKRLRVDFADAGPYSTEGAPASPSDKAVPVGSSTTTVTVRRPGDGDANFALGSPSRPFDSNDDVKAESKDGQEGNNNGNQSWSEDTEQKTRSRRGYSADRDGEPSPKRIREDRAVTPETEASDPLPRSVVISDTVTNLSELVKVCPATWTGAMILKNSAFVTKMLLCAGDVTLIDSLMKTELTSLSTDTSGKQECSVSSPQATSSVVNHFLRITQRLRLDPSKLEDVSRRMTCAGSRGHCVLLAIPSSSSASSGATLSCPKENGSLESVQQRPLKNLVVYLKQKQAAGVVSLLSASSSGSANNASSTESTTASTKEVAGVLYAFPPCDFALDLLKKIAPNFSSDASSPKEDYLVVVVVKGSN